MSSVNTEDNTVLPENLQGMAEGAELAPDLPEPGEEEPAHGDERDTTDETLEQHRDSDVPAAEPPEAGEAPKPDAELVAWYDANGHLASNFAVAKVTAGQEVWADGSSARFHVAHVRGRRGVADLELKGNAYDVRAWNEAGAEHALTVPSPREFQTRLHMVLDGRGEYHQDPELLKLMVVGTHRLADGRLIVSDGREFADGELQCPYSGLVFDRDGDPALFDRIAALSTDDTWRGVLVHLLGAPLKPAFGSVYPHAILTGDRGSGKTTAKDVLCERLGLRQFGAPAELRTCFRREKMVANTNLPILLDEIGRARRTSLKEFGDLLNICYGVGPSTWGPRGRKVVLMAPVLMLGQDCPFQDEALLSKVIIHELSEDAKDGEALRALVESAGPFPMGVWLEFACNRLNGSDVADLVEAKRAVLLEQAEAELEDGGAAVDRTTTNYALQLVVADLLLDFGVEAHVQDYMVARYRAHLELLNEAGAGVAERFVRDLAVLLAGKRPPALLVDEDEGDVYVHVESTLEVLRKRGKRYDVSDPRVVTRLLRELGFGESCRHRFQGHQLRCVALRREHLVDAAAPGDHRGGS
jgi:hypothetical protein